MIKLLRILLIFLLLQSPALAATYYIDKDGGDDSNAGTTGVPWEYCPGMESYSGGGSLSAGDTVYFDSSDTWTTGSGDDTILDVVAGVTYIGNLWPSADTDCSDGGCAKFDLNGALNESEAIVLILASHATEETALVGFDIDGNNYASGGIVTVGNWHMSADINGAAGIRIEDNYVHHNAPGSTGAWNYGIYVNPYGAYDIEHVEVLNNVVHEVGEEGIAIYAFSGAAGYGNDALVRGNEVYDTGQDRSSSYRYGIIVRNDFNNVTVEFNYLHDNTDDGIHVDGDGNANDEPKTGLVIRYNISTGNGWGIYFGGSTQTEADVYGNLIFSNTLDGIYFESNFTDTSNDVVIYNNSFYNNSDNDIEVNTSANFTTLDVYNNIVPGGISDSGSEIDNSDDNPTGTPNYKNTSNLPTGFSGTYGTDMEPNADGLSIESGSEIDAGTDMGDSYRGAINLSGTNGGNTRDDYTPWDIGAYEYQSTSTPTMSGMSSQ